MTVPGLWQIQRDSRTVDGLASAPRSCDARKSVAVPDALALCMQRLSRWLR